MAHLNARGEVCHCGFGRFMPDLGWEIQSGVLEPPHSAPLRPMNELIELQASFERMLAEIASPALKAGILQSLTDVRKEMTEHQRRADVLAKPDTWTCIHCDGAGCEQCDWTGEYNPGPTEPAPEEPNTSEQGQHVQIGNDEPGVATIGA